MPVSDPIVIVGSARMPIGAFQGDFKDLTAPELGAAAIRASVERATLPSDAIDEVLLGCVLPAGLGQAPARQAALGAGLSASTGAVTINKMCGSGMKAVMLAHDLLLAGSAKIVVAGGMESMSNAPYLLDRARGGYRMGHGRVLDHMFLDGLEDAYDKGRLMGTYAEDCAQSYAFTRQAQDEFALASLSRAQRATPALPRSARPSTLASLSRAQRATANGSFSAEIVPLAVNAGKTERIVAHDELPLKATPEKIPHLKPAFREGGTVTAANSSAISDGAAALVLMRRSEADRRGLKPLAAIAAHATFANTPALFPTAPIGAIRRLMQQTGWTTHDVRSIRNQRGLRCCRHGGHARSRPAPRKSQRPRRRLRARSSHRCIRRAHPRHAACGPRAAQSAPRSRLTLHRRRRGDSRRNRTTHLIFSERNPRLERARSNAALRARQRSLAHAAVGLRLCLSRLRRFHRHMGQLPR